MMKRDLAPAFKIAPDATAHIREYRDGDLHPKVRDHWLRRMGEAVEPVSNEWRANLAIKVVTDLDGNEQLFPVIVVESENLP